MSILIKNATIVDAESKFNGKKVDILIEKKRIIGITYRRVLLLATIITNHLV